ncbi:MAG: glycosyltransferase family 4 protein [Frankiaceae bacterium]|nr:glycosyltransferase family 4 protein [Frankiaceae bacterium]MBV9870562.1 glycosyltransferase family 4 protein [Frankiaceae bacterium]
MPELSVLIAVAQSTGGIGHHVATIARGLARRDVAVTICAPADTIHAMSFDALPCRVITAPLGASDPVALHRVRKTLRAETSQVDVVHAHGLRAGADCATFGHLAPLVVTWHNAPLGGLAWRVAHGALSRYVARRADLTLAASDDLAAAARRFGARRVRSTFVAAPVLLPPSRSAAEMRTELGVGERPVVLAIGRLQRQKRLDVLVTAAAAWADQPDGPVVVVAGDGPDHDALAAQIAATSAPVKLIGGRGDVPELLGMADVVALPSEWEARSLVAREALQAGVPLVTTGVGGLASLVGEAAEIVPVGDAEALRASLESILRDDAKRDRMIALGRARARSWPDEAGSVDELMAEYLDLIRRVRLHSE